MAFVFVLFHFLISSAEEMKSSEPLETAAAKYDSNCPDSEENIEAIKATGEMLDRFPQAIADEETRQRKHFELAQRELSSGTTCEDYNKIWQAREIANGRLANAAKKIEELSVMINELKDGVDAIKANPTPEQMSCMDFCLLVSQKAPVACQKECKFTNTQMKIRDFSNIEKAANCRPRSPATEIPLIAAYKISLKDIRLKLEPAMKIVSAVKSKYESQKKVYTNFVRETSAKLDKFPDPSCAAKKKAELQTINDGVLRANKLKDELEWQGSLFYGKDANGKIVPITAMHVSRPNDPANLKPQVLFLDRADSSDRLDTLSEQNDIVKNIFLKASEDRAPLFSVNPGEHDLSNDLTIGKPVTNKNIKSFPVIAGDQQPQIGQKFTLAGYPASRGTNFTTHKCEFKGYAPTLGKTMGYAMYCPSLEAIPSGISGGPMIDEQGRVWGANSVADDVGANYIIVAPISTDKNGNIQTGIRNRFSSENCLRYSPQGYEPYQCQVFEGSQDTNVP